MNNMRLFVWMALFAVGFLLWQAWQTDYNRPKQAAESTNAQITDAVTQAPVNADVPASSLPVVENAGDAPQSVKAAVEDSVSTAPERIITVETDVLSLRIDTRGGTLRSVDLLKYPKEANQREPVVRLLDDTNATWFVAQSGLVASSGSAPNHQSVFVAERDRYVLEAGSDQLEVPLTWTDANGITVTKTYSFRRGEYLVQQRQTISNSGTVPWVGSAYQQLQRGPPPPKKGGFSITDPQQFSFVGAAWYSKEEKFEKLAFEDFADDPLKDVDDPLKDRKIAGGWAAMLQHYYLVAWIPEPDKTVKYSTVVLGTETAPRYLLRQEEPGFEVAPGASASTETRLYLGPKLQEKLKHIAPGLGLALDYGMVRLFAEPLFRFVLNPLHKLTGNWGWAIILTTVLLKILLYPLAAAQYRSMAKLRMVQPRMEALKQRYGDDKQKYNQAMMELYQKEKINPAGGCLPLIPQMFLFIALYWVLIESVEMRHAPFMGWLTNLTAHDPYFVLPVLNALTMWITQRMTPPPAGMDPMQQKILQYMPLAFSVIMIFFPSGLVLYWTVNGALGVLQQWWITRQALAKKPA
jgi:YidC/Oxa1 family membrane protein insertase